MGLVMNVGAAGVGLVVELGVWVGSFMMAKAAAGSRNFSVIEITGLSAAGEGGGKRVMEELGDGSGVGVDVMVRVGLGRTIRFGVVGGDLQTVTGTDMMFGDRIGKVSGQSTGDVTGSVVRDWIGLVGLVIDGGIHEEVSFVVGEGIVEEVELNVGA